MMDQEIYYLTVEGDLKTGEDGVEHPFPGSDIPDHKSRQDLSLFLTTKIERWVSVSKYFVLHAVPGECL